MSYTTTIGASATRRRCARRRDEQDLLPDRQDSPTRLVRGRGDAFSSRCWASAITRAEGIKAGMIAHLDSAEPASARPWIQPSAWPASPSRTCIVTVTCGRLQERDLSASVALALRRGARGRHRARLGRRAPICRPRRPRRAACAPDRAIASTRTPASAIRAACAASGSASTSTPSPPTRAAAQSRAVRRALPSRVASLVAAPYAERARRCLVADEAKLGVPASISAAAPPRCRCSPTAISCMSMPSRSAATASPATSPAALSAPLDDAERLKTLHGSAFAGAVRRARDHHLSRRRRMTQHDA